MDKPEKPKKREKLEKPDKPAVKIRSYSFEEFVERVRAFHGFAAPGVLIGGFMVDLAYRHLPQKGSLMQSLKLPSACLMRFSFLRHAPSETAGLPS